EDAGDRDEANEPRGKVYRGVGLVLEKEAQEEAERLLQEYARSAPKRNGDPSPAWVHVWLGQLDENRNDLAEAKKEVENALRLDPKNKMAQEGLKKLKKG